MSVTSFEIARRSIFADGRSFASAGQYEVLTGVVRLAVDPDHPANGTITDLGLAPRGEDGLVHFDADFSLLRPVDAERGNGRVFFDVPNRGRQTAPYALNRATGDPDPGDGFLMRRGYSIASCGWQHDLPAHPGLLGLRAPEALERGEPLTGRVLCEFQPGRATQAVALGEPGLRSYPALDLAEPTATLAVREHLAAPPQLLPRDRWRFARLEGGEPVPDATSVYLAEGFEPGKLYECVYTAVGAPVVGVGLLAVRDVAAWLRHGDAASGNPCAGAIRHAYAYGSSQSGHFLRQLLYLGLNEDELGRQVFDGMLLLVAGGRRGETNLRFGQPGKTIGRYVGALFPFADRVLTDPVTGQSDGLLARLLARDRVPKVIALDSSAEYWSRQSSLGHTDTEGTRDIDPPDSTRLYLMAGTQHGGEAVGGLPLRDLWLGFTRVGHPENSVDYLPLVRRALDNLDAWVVEGREPPPSRFPRLGDGTAASPDRVREFFGAIQGVRFPARLPELARLDFGPETASGVLTNLPPLEGEPYPSFVPALDEDGNEVGGIRLPDVAVPLATYTGWNVRHADIGAPGEILLRAGATLPFPRTAEERRVGEDPRRAIEERYASKEEYLGRIRAAAADLVRARHLLEEDVVSVVERAALRWDLSVGGLRTETVTETR